MAGSLEGSHSVIARLWNRYQETDTYTMCQIKVEARWQHPDRTVPFGLWLCVTNSPQQEDFNLTSNPSNMRVSTQTIRNRLHEDNLRSCHADHQYSHPVALLSQVTIRPREFKVNSCFNGFLFGSQMKAGFMIPLHLWESILTFSVRMSGFRCAKDRSRHKMPSMMHGSQWNSLWCNTERKNLAHFYFIK